MKMSYKNIVARAVQKSFSFWQTLGIHVVPKHFYEPIPDTRLLNDDIWRRRTSLAGIDINQQKQIDLLKTFTAAFMDEYKEFPLAKTASSYQYYVNNGMYESVDGEILYCMTRYFKPKKIIEIGCGYTTFLIAQAISRNSAESETNTCELTAIDPYPKPILHRGFPGLTNLIEAPVEKVPVSQFQKLQANDILFIDSSHTLKIGGDVWYEYLEILPQLNKGVIVAFHDIFLPEEYPKHWVLKHHRFWNEQYLLQTFLVFNNAWEVLWAGNWMHINHPQMLSKAFRPSDRNGHKPGSFWIRRCK